MKAFHKKLLTSLIGSLAVGALMVVPIVTSQNGYVAGFIMFPLLLLVAGICLILFIIGFAFLLRENMAGLYFLLAVLALPTGFIGSTLIAKQLELGAYREEPMRPVVSEIANKVLFKKEASHEEVERFWSHVIGNPTSDRGGHASHPGVRSGMRPGPENGHEVIVFEFWPDATEDQKNDIRDRISNYPPVYQYLENVDTTTTPQVHAPTDSANTKQPHTVREPNTFKHAQ